MPHDTEKPFRAHDHHRSANDSALLRLYAATGANDAFTELVRRHLDGVYSSALRRVGGDVQLAEDVAQRVFVALARKADAVAHHPILGAWLYITTRNEAANVVRTERRRRAHEQEAHAMSHLLNSREQPPPDWDAIAPLLDAAIDQLGERDRAAVVLRFIERRRFSEIGVALVVSEDAARMRVERALEKLHRLLARRGVTSTASALGIVLVNEAVASAPAGLTPSVTAAALAAAATPGAASLGVFTFMTTTKITAGVVGFITLFALGTAIYQTRNTREAAAELSATAKRAQQAEAALGLAQKQLAASHVPASATNAASHERNGAGSLDYVLDHPETRAAYLERAALAINARFERFFRTAGLTGEQQDQFLKLAIGDAEGRLDALAKRRAAGGLDPSGSHMDPAVIEKLGAEQQQRDSELTNKLRELLGVQFKPAMDTLKEVSERNTVERLAGRLYATAPLTTEQADQLTQVLLQNQFQAQQNPTSTNMLGGTFIPREMINGVMAQPAAMAMPWMTEAPVTDAAVTRAGTVLTPPQLAALKALQAEQAAELQLVLPAKRKDAKS